MRKEKLFSILGECGINYKHLMAEFTTSEKLATICILMGKHSSLETAIFLAFGKWGMRLLCSLKETGFIIHYLEKRVNLIYEFLYFIPLRVSSSCF
jgi:hypothetical protein